MYVHFPFCLQKCPYCDFLSIPTGGGPIPHEAYADAVLAELERRATRLAPLPLHSVFFGGGTPSLWKARELGRVLSRILGQFQACSAGVEVTAECNPSSFDARVADELQSVGVNRISMGVQSLNADRLRFLGRLHDEHAGLAAIQLARHAGFSKVSADLIFGVAGQSPEDAAAEAQSVAEAGPTHLSAYALTIEPGTRFGELSRRGRLPLLTDDSVADAFGAVEAALSARGFMHYEISNYARPGAQARHNLGYWRGEPYLGLGVGAWGTLGAGGNKVRYRNTPSLERYLRMPEEPFSGSLFEEGPLVAVLEPLSPETDLSERIMLGLRLDEGIDPKALETLTRAPFWTPPRRRAVKKWLARGALVFEAGRLRLDKSHWLTADSVTRELL